MDQKAASSAHIVARAGVQLIAVRHALEGLHVAKGVRSWRKRTNANLALAIRIIAAGSRLTAAAAGGVDVRAIKSSAIKMVLADRVRVRTASCSIELGY